MSKLQGKYSKNTNLSCLRLAANYSSKEAADEEEPELDLSTVPSLDEHIMKDDVSLPLPGYVARRGVPGPPMHYRLRPIERGKLVFRNFTSHFICVQIFQIDFALILNL